MVLSFNHGDTLRSSRPLTLSPTANRILHASRAPVAANDETVKFTSDSDSSASNVFLANVSKIND